MKKYNKKAYEMIQNQIRGCETVAGYLAENLEKIPFADLRERLENLRDLIYVVKENLRANAIDTID